MAKLNKREQNFLAKFDELNTLAEVLLVTKKDEAISEFEDLLIEAYLAGFDYAKEMLEVEDEDIKPAIRSFLDKSYQGESVGAKFSDYYDKNDQESLTRLMDCEYHRVYNEGMFECAEQYSYRDVESEGSLPFQAKPRYEIQKTWKTLQDEKVRLTHEFLDGVTLPLWERFYTIDGDSALYPSGFAFASNNCNCRCIVVYSKVLATE